MYTIERFGIFSSLWVKILIFVQIFSGGAVGGVIIEANLVHYGQFWDKIPTFGDSHFSFYEKLAHFMC